MTPDQTLAYARKRFVQDLGFTDEQFYGIFGSVMGESGHNLDPKSFNPTDPDGGAHGIFQHVGPRWRSLQAYAEANGADPYDPRTQIDFVADVELLGAEKKAYAAVKATSNRADAAKAWTDSFERPDPKNAHHDIRAQNASVVANKFGAGAVPDWDTEVTTTSSAMSAAGGGSGDLLQQLGYGLGSLQPTEKLSLDGPSMLLQKLMIGGAAYKEPDIGAQFMLDLMGGGGREGRHLKPGEAALMTLGGALGGIPGAMLGDMVHQLLVETFSPKRGLAAPDAAGQPGATAKTPVEGVSSNTTSLTGAILSQPEPQANGTEPNLLPLPVTTTPQPKPKDPLLNPGGDMQASASAGFGGFLQSLLGLF